VAWGQNQPEDYTKTIVSESGRKFLRKQSAGKTPKDIVQRSKTVEAIPKLFFTGILGVRTANETVEKKRGKHKPVLVELYNWGV